MDLTEFQGRHYYKKLSPKILVVQISLALFSCHYIYELNFFINPIYVFNVAQQGFKRSAR